MVAIKLVPICQNNSTLVLGSNASMRVWALVWHSHTHTYTESSQTKLETERLLSAVACISGLLLPFHSHVHCLINPSEPSFVRTQRVNHANIIQELFTACQWGLKYDCGTGGDRHLCGDDEKINKHSAK